MHVCPKGSGVELKKHNHSESFCDVFGGIPSYVIQYQWRRAERWREGDARDLFASQLSLYFSGQDLKEEGIWFKIYQSLLYVKKMGSAFKLFSSELLIFWMNSQFYLLHRILRCRLRVIDPPQATRYEVHELLVESALSRGVSLVIGWSLCVWTSMDDGMTESRHRLQLFFNLESDEQFSECKRCLMMFVSNLSSLP